MDTGVGMRAVASASIICHKYYLMVTLRHPKCHVKVL